MQYYVHIRKAHKGNKMISCTETVKLREIKFAIKQGLEVSDFDKQWVIDLCKREGTPVHPKVADNAAAQGFDTAGIKTF